MILRSPARSLTLVSGLALGVALVVSVLFFVESSSGQLTQTAIALVPVDMVGHVTTPTLDESKVISQFKAEPGVTAVEPLDTVELSAMSNPAGGAKTPPAKLFAIDSSFLNVLSAFDLLRVSGGAFDANGVLVSEATASRLGLKVGDAITLEMTALATPYQTKVTGVLDTSHAGVLLSGGREREGEFRAVPDVAVMDRALFNQDLRGPLLATATQTPTNPAVASPTSSASSTGLPPIDQQQFIKIDHSKLPANPGNALVQVEALRRTMERQFTGQVTITNYVARSLTSAQADVLSAKLLFVFLALPGIALAIFLSRYASELYGESQRREIGLLRARGASSAQVIAIAAASAALLGVAGSVLGFGLGMLVTLATRGSNALADASTGTFLGIAPWAVSAGLVMAVIASFMPTWNAVRLNVMAERRRVKRTERAPFWKRSWMDVGMLVAGALVLLTVHLAGGFNPGGAGEGQTILLSSYLFLAPVFFWIGLTLFMQRLLVRFIPIFAKSAAGRSSGFGQVAARGMGWRANRLSSAITVIALTLSFGVSLALFTSTFDTQKATDQHYVIGSDVRVTPATGVTQDPGLEQRLLVPGATAVTGVMQDTQALIGSERQVVYGIDAPSFAKTAFLPDSFVQEGSAQDLLAKLQSTPNGVVVSVEAATNLGLVVGDPLLVRVSTVSGGYNDDALVVVGTFTIFPTSAQNSDFVINRSLMAQTRNTTVNDFYLVRADGTAAGAASVAAKIKAGFSSASPARVDDLTTALTADQSTLTNLNLNGLSRIDWIFTLVIAFAGFGIFLLAAIGERAKEFSTMRAVGASPGQLRRLLVIEGGGIMLFGVLLSLPIGFVIARVLVTLLTSIFLTPVGGLSVSLAPLLLLIGASATGLAVALALASLVLPRISLGTVLREE
jgi:putative ABC transport system permease protein